MASGDDGSGEVASGEDGSGEHASGEDGSGEEGSGDDCREGGSALLHFSVHSVAAEGELAVFDSTVAHPHGVRVAVGLDRHAEVLGERLQRHQR